MDDYSQYFEVGESREHCLIEMLDQVVFQVSVKRRKEHFRHRLSRFFFPVCCYTLYWLRRSLPLKLTRAGANAMEPLKTAPGCGCSGVTCKRKGRTEKAQSIDRYFRFGDARLFKFRQPFTLVANPMSGTLANQKLHLLELCDIHWPLRLR